MASPGPQVLVAQRTEAPDAFCPGNEKSRAGFDPDTLPNKRELGV